MLEVGDSPSDFVLTDDRGEEVRWEDLRGSPVVVFFYPKASTPGCTTEACDFRDLQAEFAARNVRVFGASADSVKRQSNFRDKHTLSMPLLSDPDHVILEPWGVWAEKKNYGKTYWGVQRATFLIDPDGNVARVWPRVKVTGHAQEVLEAVREATA